MGSSTTAMAESIWLVGCIVFCCVIVPMLGLPIASLVVASQSVSNCSATATIPLTTWLDVYGGVSLGYIGLAMVCTIITFWVKTSKTMMIVGLAVPIWLFHLAWSIFGALILFIHSSTCQTEDHPLWAMTLSALIFEWIALPSAFAIKLVL